MSNELKDPALISGTEAKLAWAKGEALQINKKDTHFGFIDMSNDYSLGVFDNDDYEFRLKPTTLTVNAELPKPNKETQHNSLVYAVTYEFKTREERNAFADKLRGTNS